MRIYIAVILSIIVTLKGLIHAIDSIPGEPEQCFEYEYESEILGEIEKNQTEFVNSRLDRFLQYDIFDDQAYDLLIAAFFEWVELAGVDGLTEAGVQYNEILLDDISYVITMLDQVFIRHKTFGHVTDSIKNYLNQDDEDGTFFATLAKGLGTPEGKEELNKLSELEGEESELLLKDTKLGTREDLPVIGQEAEDENGGIFAQFYSASNQVNSMSGDMSSDLENFMGSDSKSPGDELGNGQGNKKMKKGKKKKKKRKKKEKKEQSLGDELEGILEL